MSFSQFMLPETDPPISDPPVSHLKRIILVGGAFGKRDPSLFISMFALWVMLNGLSLVSTEDSFSKGVVYIVARDLGLNDNYVGISMMINAVALMWGLGNTPPRVRASISLVTGILWMFWSIILFLGGLKAGLYSGSAVWTMTASLALMRTAATHALSIPPTRQEENGRVKS